MNSVFQIDDGIHGIGSLLRKSGNLDALVILGDRQLRGGIGKQGSPSFLMAVGSALLGEFLQHLLVIHPSGLVIILVGRGHQNSQLAGFEVHRGGDGRHNS